MAALASSRPHRANAESRRPTKLGARATSGRTERSIGRRGGARASSAIMFYLIDIMLIIGTKAQGCEAQGHEMWELRAGSAAGPSWAVPAGHRHRRRFPVIPDNGRFPVIPTTAARVRRMLAEF